MSEFMRNYEVTFIVDPVLSGDEIKATAQTYIEQLEKEGCTIVHVDEMGLRTLAYPIKKRNSGVYFCIEFSAADGTMIDMVELALRRDERIMRFLTAALDKFGVKYNDDKRKGLIGKVEVKKKESKSEDRDRDRDRDRRPAAPKKAEEKKAAPAEEAVAEAPEIEAAAPVTAPVVEAAAPEAPQVENTVDEVKED